MLTIENLYILVAALALICVMLTAFLINAKMQNAKQREALENLAILGPFWSCFCTTSSSVVGIDLLRDKKVAWLQSR